MSPVKAEIELRRKILSERYCRKGDPDSRTLQNTIKKFTGIGCGTAIYKMRYKNWLKGNAVKCVINTRSKLEIVCLQL